MTALFAYAPPLDGYMAAAFEVGLAVVVMTGVLLWGFYRAR